MEKEEGEEEKFHYELMDILLFLFLTVIYNFEMRKLTERACLLTARLTSTFEKRDERLSRTFTIQHVHSYNRC